MKQFLFTSAVVCLSTLTSAIATTNNKFEQIDDWLPTPTEARLASGAPGPAYWQQEANYRIEVELDEKRSRLEGSGTIEYVNHSPHTLDFLWVQLDQNAFAQDSKRQRSIQAPNMEKQDGNHGELEFQGFRSFLYNQEFEGGYELETVTDASGAALDYEVINTNMRIALDTPLAPGGSFTFYVKWAFNLQDEAMSMRHGRKRLKSGDYIYQVAQWYPRMCAYYDQEGWQTKPYIGHGEFALEFGDFEVHITVPADFVVAATGTLINANEVLSDEVIGRLNEARSSEQVVMIVTEEEAEENLKRKSRNKKTWKFEAERVRDFAFAGSRGYLWDAVGVQVEGETVMAMSLYPAEAEAIWKRFSTEAVAQTLRVYSGEVYPYPYPVAWSTWGPIGGMEYPMISFQSSREIDDKGTYPAGQRNYVISVVIHEVGHNWFPMIINSDERQWQWLDEGLNSFYDYRAGNLMDPVVRKSNLDSDQRVITMMAAADDPITMMSADNQPSRGFQAYSKPALGLQLLRESILGPENFEFAMKEYAKRWAFKRPTPADFFRTIEDASGVDLDWFWRGWFYGNDHVDMAIEQVSVYRLDDGNPETSKALDKAEEDTLPPTPHQTFLEEAGTLADRNSHLQDWYYAFDPHKPTEKETQAYDKKISKLEDWQKELLEFNKLAYVITVKNEGGLIMPLVFDITLQNGKNQRLSVPVEIWRYGNESVKIPFLSDHEVIGVELDRDNAFADYNLANNIYPRKIEEGRFKLKTRKPLVNPMKIEINPDLDDEKDDSQ